MHSVIKLLTLTITNWMVRDGVTFLNATLLAKLLKQVVLKLSALVWKQLPTWIQETDT